MYHERTTIRERVYAGLDLGVYVNPTVLGVEPWTGSKSTSSIVRRLRVHAYTFTCELQAGTLTHFVARKDLQGDQLFIHVPVICN